MLCPLGGLLRVWPGKLRMAGQACRRLQQQQSVSGRRWKAFAAAAVNSHGRPRTRLMYSGSPQQQSSRGAVVLLMLYFVRYSVESQCVTFSRCEMFILRCRGFAPSGMLSPSPKVHEWRCNISLASSCRDCVLVATSQAAWRRRRI